MTIAGLAADRASESRLPAAAELIDFLDGLRRQGWPIDPRQMTACCRVLALARDGGDDSAWCQRLPYRLAPVIARRPHEQAEFRKRFAAAFPRGAAAVDQVGIDERTPAKEPARVPFYQHSWFIGAMAAALVAALGLLAIGLAPPPPEVEDAPPSAVVAEPPPEAVPPADQKIEVAPRTEIQTRSIPSPYAPPLTMLATLAPLILLLGWLAWRWGHRLLWLAPGAVSPDLSLSKLRLPPSITRALFTSIGFRAAAQDLRRHRPVISADLDVDRSIDATIANAGFFTAVARQRPQLPEYVFLIERLAGNDHLARLFELAVGRLHDEGVMISTYFYHEDPRHLTPAQEPHAPTGIREVAGLAGDHRLIVVGTADGFFHPISGDVHRWVHDFDPWSSRTVLSTRPIEEWTRAELQLLDEGFALATARSSGLTRLADRVNHGIDDEPELLEGVVITLAPARARARERAEDDVDIGQLLARMRDLLARAETAAEAAPYLDDLRKVEGALTETPADAATLASLRAALDRLSRIRSPAWLATPRLWAEARRARSLEAVPASEPPAPELILRVVTDTIAEEDRERRLRSGELVIGHSHSADWNLPDPDSRLARAHCVIEFRGNVPVLRNLSTGGVFIDDADDAIGFGMAVELYDGMRLTIGNHTIAVRLAARREHQPSEVRSEGVEQLTPTAELEEETYQSEPSRPGHRIVEIRRRNDANKAVLFVHGASEVWGELPTLLGSEPALTSWDVLSLSYRIGLLPDIRGVWAADPDAPILALHFRTRLRIAPLLQYRSVAIVAHSMGGLVVQRALLDDPDLVPRISHVILFGTPSGGLIKAGFFAFLNPQLRNMAADGTFVKQLRDDWDKRFDGAPPFELLVVAGDRDQFVPPHSSLDPFPGRFRRVVAGDHLSMIKASGNRPESLRLLVATLSGQAEPPAASAPLLTQSSEMSDPEFERAFTEREDRLTHADVVNAAIRLDLDGKRQQAIELLERHLHLGADVKATLGGRYKRLWLESGDKAFAHQALELYRDGLSTAETDRQRKSDEYHEQVYYCAINLAFMAFVAFDLKEEAVANARLALEHCAKAPRHIWRVATEAEAKLYLDQPAEALATYREVVRMRGEPWQLQSAGQQAYYVARKLGNEALQENLRTLFNPEWRQKNRIFISYSHRNRDWLERLQLMMSPYLRRGELELWDDTRIGPGEKWLDEMETALRTCNVAVLLVTKEFLASESIREQELPMLLAAADRGEVKLLWLYLSPAFYEETPLNAYQAAHDPARPLASLPPLEQDRVLKDVARRIELAAFD